MISDRESLLSATEILLQINNYRNGEDMQKNLLKRILEYYSDYPGLFVIDLTMGKQ